MTQLTENVHVQFLREPIHIAIGPSHTPTRRRYDIRHIVNPYEAAPRSEEARIQKLTLHTMSIARATASLPVTVSAVTFADETVDVPQGFALTRSLKRSSQDLASFARPRRLPLLFDVLEEGARGASADFIVFTNMDIALLPHFYPAIQRLLEAGFDGLLVNRRTIYKYGLDPGLLPLMYADMGEPHDGFDCFVFPARLLAQFEKTPVFIGIPEVARALLFNMVALCDRILILRDAHLTFHLGDDKAWAAPDLADYHRHNLQAAQQVIDVHAVDAKKRARLAAFCEKHRERYTVR